MAEKKLRGSKWATEPEIDSYMYEHNCDRHKAIMHLRLKAINKAEGEKETILYKRNRFGIYEIYNRKEMEKDDV